MTTGSLILIGAVPGPLVQPEFRDLTVRVGAALLLAEATRFCMKAA